MYIHVYVGPRPSQLTSRTIAAWVAQRGGCALYTECIGLQTEKEYDPDLVLSTMLAVLRPRPKRLTSRTIFACKEDLTSTNTET